MLISSTSPAFSPQRLATGAGGVRPGAEAAQSLPRLLDRDRYDGKLYEKYQDRIGKPGSFLKEDDKDYLGLLYAEAEAKGGNALDADDPKMKKVDKVAMTLVKARVLEQLTPPDPEARTDDERIAAGEDTRRMSRNYQRAQAVAEEQEKARNHRSVRIDPYADEAGRVDTAL